ncbi:hypothetical protein GE061_010483 [Apolygus lucorum]|uniref:Peptidase S1 domain-containing protein n=1 Tax=Apolygus lucorum TaxID=248454 RepID=A0A8S9XW08_APOLU|nr:hypothetical protein GE061_010483 [Apolygus lucorum]
MKVVVVSVSNMNQVIIPGRKPRYYNEISALSVIAGNSNVDPDQYETPPPGVQHVKVYAFCTETSTITGENDAEYDLTQYLKFRVFDGAPKINIGFLETYNALQWSDQVKPMHLGFEPSLLPAKTEELVNILENPILPVKACRIGGWKAGSSRKVFHTVLYVPKDLCRTAYCGYNINACFDFLKASSHHEVCFKSAYWGGPCAKDTGSALFCTFFDGGNVFAILTTSINCEMENLPCVYTTMNQVILQYKNVFGL